MNLAITLICLVTKASTVPVMLGVTKPPPEVRLDNPIQGNPMIEASNQKPSTHVIVQIQPSVQQPHSQVPQQPDQQPDHVLLPVQHQPWPPQGGAQFLMPFQPNIQAPHPGAQPGSVAQQPQFVSPYGFFPLFSPPHWNQQFSPYGFPMNFPAPSPQDPSKPMGPEAPIDTTFQQNTPAKNKKPEEQEQQQIPHIIYMYQQPMNAALGGLSSEELEQMASKVGRTGVYFPGVEARIPMGTAKASLASSPSVGSFNQGVFLFSQPSAGQMAPEQGIYPASATVGGPAALSDPVNLSEGLEIPGWDSTTAPILNHDKS